MNFKINDKLYKEINKFCEINEIKDINQFINSLIIKAFNVEKYGDLNAYSLKELNIIKDNIIDMVDNLLNVNNTINETFKDYSFEELTKKVDKSNVEEDVEIENNVIEIENNVIEIENNTTINEVEEDLDGYKLTINKTRRRR